MVQKSNKHTAVKPVQKAEAVKKQECKCDDTCKCGDSCTCKSSCGCGPNIINGILVLVGTLFVAGSVLVLADKIDTPRRPMGSRPAVAGRMDDKAFADFIKKNPQIIIDSVNAFYQKQQAAQGDGGCGGGAPADNAGARPAPRMADAAMVAEIVADKGNHVLGNPKGSFVMIEFFDYNCGYCKMMNKKMAEAVKKSKNIRWILIDTPIFGEKSEIIAQYAWAAAQQGKFQEYHEALGDAADKSEAGLKAIGQKLGLDGAKLEKDAHSEAAKAKLAANREYTKKLQMGGVPMFIVDGAIQGGAFPDAQMDEYIKKANSGAKAKGKKAKK